MFEGRETDASLAVLKTMPGKVLEKIKAQQTADHRMGVPEDIAMIVGFLASEESRWIKDANVPAK